MLRGEEGQETWKQFLDWLNTPPSTDPSPVEPSAPAPSRAALIRAEAESRVGDQSAAFAAFIEA